MVPCTLGEVLERKRQMTAILNIFRRNWGLKLIALILALVIYYSMQNASGKTGSSKSDVTQNLFMKGTTDGGTGK